MPKVIRKQAVSSRRYTPIVMKGNTVPVMSVTEACQTLSNQGSNVMEGLLQIEAMSVKAEFYKPLMKAGALRHLADILNQDNSLVIEVIIRILNAFVERDDPPTAQIVSFGILIRLFELMVQGNVLAAQLAVMVVRQVDSLPVQKYMSLLAQVDAQALALSVMDLLLLLQEMDECDVAPFERYHDQKYCILVNSMMAKASFMAGDIGIIDVVKELFMKTGDILLSEGSVNDFDTIQALGILSEIVTEFCNSDAQVDDTDMSVDESSSFAFDQTLNYGYALDIMHKIDISQHFQVVLHLNYMLQALVDAASRHGCVLGEYQTDCYTIFKVLDKVQRPSTQYYLLMEAVTALAALYSRDGCAHVLHIQELLTSQFLEQSVTDRMMIYKAKVNLMIAISFVFQQGNVTDPLTIGQSIVDHIQLMSSCQWDGPFYAQLAAESINALIDLYKDDLNDQTEQVHNELKVALPKLTQRVKQYDPRQSQESQYQAALEIVQQQLGLAEDWHFDVVSCMVVDKKQVKGRLQEMVDNLKRFILYKEDGIR